MARAIDKETMLDLIIKAKRTDPETGSFAEWLAEYLVEHAPTLTPPNEPLSIGQLREMDGEPVWLDVADGVGRLLTLMMTVYGLIEAGALIFTN